MKLLGFLLVAAKTEEDDCAPQNGKVINFIKPLGWAKKNSEPKSYGTKIGY